MSLNKSLLIALMGASLSVLGMGAASAATWQDTHPRRVEVNHRLANQDARINRAVHEGRITRWQAAYLHHRDQTIRMRERKDASFHEGHLTRGEAARLNHQENGVSGQIYRDAH